MGVDMEDAHAGMTFGMCSDGSEGDRVITTNDADDLALPKEISDLTVEIHTKAGTCSIRLHKVALHLPGMTNVPAALDDASCSLTLLLVQSLYDLRRRSQEDAALVRLARSAIVEIDLSAGLENRLRAIGRPATRGRCHVPRDWDEADEAVRLSEGKSEDP